MGTKQHKISKFYIVLILHCFLCIRCNFTSFIYLCKGKDLVHKVIWMIVQFLSYVLYMYIYRVSQEERT